MEPINYMLDVANPLQMALGGYETALGQAQTRQQMGLANTQEARAAEAFALEKRAMEEQRAAAERQRAEAERGQAAFMRLAELGNNATSDDFLQAWVANPAMRQDISSLKTMLEGPKLDTMLKTSQDLYAAARLGNVDAVRNQLTLQFEAANNSGDEGMAATYGSALDLLNTNPEAAMQSIGTMNGLTILGIKGPEYLGQVDKQLGVGQGAKSTEGFNTVDQKLRAAGIVPLSEGGDGRYEAAMEQSVSGGGKGDFSLTVDSQTGAVSFSQGTGAGAGAGKPATGYVNVQTDAGVEQRVITGSPAAQEVTATAAQLDAAMEQADRLVSLVKSVRDDQELNAVTGFAEGRMPTGRPSLSPETIQARQDLIVKIDQLKGNVFLQAYESLKGSGQITEIEGIKAEAAIARMNRAQGTPAFKEALNDFLDVVSTAQKRIERQKSGLPKTTAPTAGEPAGGRARYDENGDRIK
jgi:hypothetical protein